MTWFKSEQGYELFFNRDEQKTRSRATLPSIQTQHGLKLISPTDEDAGGSWIAVNQFGVTVSLLNHYQYEQIATYQEWVSRGHIVRKFATTRTIKEAKVQFKKLNLSDYRAFRMFIVERSGSNALFVWDGHQSRVEYDVTMPKTSSSVNAQQVKAARMDAFKDLKLAQSNNVEDYIKFHTSHLPTKSEQSVCMHREDASSVSLSHISVNAKTVEFSYADGAPCKTKLAPALVIDLIDVEDLPVISLASAR